MCKDSCELKDLLKGPGVLGRKGKQPPRVAPPPRGHRVPHAPGTAQAADADRGCSRRTSGLAQFERQIAEAGRI